MLYTVNFEESPTALTREVRSHVSSLPTGAVRYIHTTTYMTSVYFFRTSHDLVNASHSELISKHLHAQELSGYFYNNATLADLAFRMESIHKVFGVNDYKVAIDFGCSKGTLSLMKNGRYGHEHGANFEYATNEYRIGIYKRLLYLYDVQLVLQFSKFVEQCKLLWADLIGQLQKESRRERTVDAEEKLLRDWCSCALSFPDRELMDRRLQRAIFDPQTLLQFSPAPPKFKDARYRTNIAPKRCNPANFDGLINFFQIGNDEDATNTMISGSWTTEQWKAYYAIRLNCAIDVTAPVPVVHCAWVEGVGAIRTSELPRYVRKDVVSSSISYKHVSSGRRQVRVKRTRSRKSDQTTNGDASDNSKKRKRKKPAHRTESPQHHDPNPTSSLPSIPTWNTPEVQTWAGRSLKPRTMMLTMDEAVQLQQQQYAPNTVLRKCQPIHHRINEDSVYLAAHALIQ